MGTRKSTNGIVIVDDVVARLQSTVMEISVVGVRNRRIIVMAEAVPRDSGASIVRRSHMVPDGVSDNLHA
jgi:hypothetical protein